MHEPVKTEVVGDCHKGYKEHVRRRSEENDPESSEEGEDEQFEEVQVRCEFFNFVEGMVRKLKNAIRVL